MKENTREKRLKTKNDSSIAAALVELKATRKDSNSELNSLKDIANSLGKSRDTANEETLNELRLLSSTIKSEFSTKISDSITELTSNTISGGRAERKEAKAQLKVLNSTIDKISDVDDKKILQQQISNLEAVVASDKKILETVGAGVGKVAPLLAGVVGAAFSNSPIVGAAIAIGADKIKEFIVKRKERKETLRKLVIEEKNAAESEVFLTKQKETLDNFEQVSNENAESLKEVIKENPQQAKDNPLLEKIEENTNKKDNSAQLLERQQESDNAAENRNDELIDAIGTVGGNVGDVKEDGGFLSGIFDAIKIPLLDFFTGTSILGSFKVFGKKLIPRLLKGFKFFLKKIPIIGPLIFGGFNIFNNLSDLGDDASIGDKLFAVIKGAADGIFDFFLGIPTAIIDFLFGTDIAGFVEEGGGFTKVIADSITDMFNFIGGIVDSAVAFLKDGAEGIIRSLPFGNEIADSIFGSAEEKELAKDPGKRQRKLAAGNTEEELDRQIAEQKLKLAATRKDAQSTFSFTTNDDVIDESEKLLELVNAKFLRRKNDAGEDQAVVSSTTVAQNRQASASPKLQKEEAKKLIEEDIALIKRSPETAARREATSERFKKKQSDRRARELLEQTDETTASTRIKQQIGRSSNEVVANGASTGSVNVLAPSTTNVNNVAESKVFIRPTAQNNFGHSLEIVNG